MNKTDIRAHRYGINIKTSNNNNSNINKHTKKQMKSLQGNEMVWQMIEPYSETVWAIFIKNTIEHFNRQTNKQTTKWTLITMTENKTLWEEQPLRSD